MKPSLVLRGSRAPGLTSLVSRTHDLSGTDYTYITSLTKPAVEAFERGAALRARLVEDAEPRTAGWRLIVVEGETEIPGFRLSDDRLLLLSEAGGARFSIEGGAVSTILRALQVARDELDEAERGTNLIRERIETLKGAIDAMRAANEADTDPAP